MPLSISMNSPTNSQAPPLRKFHHGLLLRLQPEPAKALTIGADAIVADDARGSWQATTLPLVSQSVIVLLGFWATNASWSLRAMARRRSATELGF